MKKNILRNAVLVAMLSSAFSIGANAAGLTGIGAIADIIPGTSSIRVSGLTGNPDGCGTPNLYVLQYSNPRQKELYAGLLTAKALGSDVQLFVGGCVNDGAVNIAEIRSIILK